MALRTAVYSSCLVAARATQFQSLPFSTAAPLRDVLRGEPSPKSPVADPLNKSTRPQPAAPPSIPKPASSSKPTLPVTPPIPQLLPYHVLRSRTRNLPVYLDWKAGGNLKQTQIRKIVGDTKTLSRDLAKELQIDPRLVTVGKVSGHVVIKGHFKQKVEAFLKARGF
ncbi:Translation initiation factor [Venturia nashicola]|nr:Translation initiation factor [Venturia nashicola]